MLGREEKSGKKEKANRGKADDKKKDRRRGHSQIRGPYPWVVSACYEGRGGFLVEKRVIGGKDNTNSYFTGDLSNEQGRVRKGLWGVGGKKGGMGKGGKGKCGDGYNSTASA